MNKSANEKDKAMEALRMEPVNQYHGGGPTGGSIFPPFDASNFRSKNIACIVQDEGTFVNVTYGLENLGFKVACSSSLDATFEVVSEDPEEWAMVIIRLDQPFDEERLESYVRLIRMMDVRIPILVMAGKGKSPENVGKPELYADCVVREPKSFSELSLSLKVAVDANMRWGSRFDHFRYELIEGTARVAKR